MIINRRIISGGGGQNAFIVVQAPEGTAVTCNGQTKTIGTGETEVQFAITVLATYTVTAVKDGVTKTETVVVDEFAAFFVTITFPRVPSEYQEVEYIEQTGTQYLYTQWIPSITASIAMRLRRENIKTNSYLGGNYISTPFTGVYDFAINNGSGANQYNIFFFWNNKSYGAGGSVYNITSTGLNGRIGWLKMDYNSAAVDKNTRMIATRESNSQYSSYLFYDFDSAKPFSNSDLYIYEIIGKNNDLTDMHLIPCYRKADLKTGMYDMASNRFYDNQGTSEFVLGSDVE